MQQKLVTEMKQLDVVNIQNLPLFPYTKYLSNNFVYIPNSLYIEKCIYYPHCTLSASTHFSQISVKSCCVSVNRMQKKLLKTELVNKLH